MKLPHKYGQRLRTLNFTRVTSGAATSIDYYEELEIVEIEYKTGKIYHYLFINKTVWDQFLELARKGKGLGSYISQDFKDMIDRENHDYYQLIVMSKQ
jgi:hypothetical protein